MAQLPSHTETTRKPSSNHGEFPVGTYGDLEATCARSHSSHEPLPSPKPERPNPQNLKRIPNGTIHAEIPLEAAKAYPIRIFNDLQTPPRIAYADLNTHNEHNTLTIKLLPDGGKTAPHPQIVLFVNGPYHVEQLGYNVSNPFNWTTWFETHIDAKFLDKTIDGLIRAKLALEATRA